MQNRKQAMTTPIIRLVRVAEIERDIQRAPTDFDSDDYERVAHKCIPALCAAYRKLVELLRRWDEAYYKPGYELDDETHAVLAALDAKVMNETDAITTTYYYCRLCQKPFIDNEDRFHICPTCGVCTGTPL
jgi:hypothetical protein